MRTHSFDVVLRNYSAYPIDIVWENARDLEHVAHIHRRTNYSFRLLYRTPSPTGEHPYEALFFSVRRRMLGFIPVTSIGMRKIAGPYEIWQVENSPMLGISTRLRSTLEKNAGDPEKTDMVDFVRVTVPAFLKPLEGYLRKALIRHTQIQCSEDEAFRSRRLELRTRGIDLPLSLFNLPEWDRAVADLQARLK